MKDIYNKNCKPLMNNIEKDTRKWKDILCLYIGRTIVVKLTILPKAIPKLYVTPIKNMHLFILRDRANNPNIHKND